MDRLVRYVFCYPRPDDNKGDFVTNIIRNINDLFSYLDLINFCLGIVFAARLISGGTWRNEGIVLLCGITIAFVAAHAGKGLVNGAGLTNWAPFCQSVLKYPRSKEPTVRRLFALAFTELSIFMYVDITTMIVYVKTGSSDSIDWFDRVNLFMIMVSATAATVLLLLTLAFSIDCNYFVPYTTESIGNMICAVFSRFSLAILFLLLFLVVLAVVMVAILYAVLFLFDEVRVKEDNNFAFGCWVAVVWGFGGYFLHKIYFAGALQREDDDLYIDHSRSDTMASEDV